MGILDNMHSTTYIAKPEDKDAVRHLANWRCINNIESLGRNLPIEP